MLSNFFLYWFVFICRHRMLQSVQHGVMHNIYGCLRKRSGASNSHVKRSKNELIKCHSFCVTIDSFLPSFFQVLFTRFWMGKVILNWTIKCHYITSSGWQMEKKQNKINDVIQLNFAQSCKPFKRSEYIDCFRKKNIRTV